MTTPLLSVSDLRVEFRVRGGVLHAVNGLSYDLYEQETLAILGESGSGKSVAALAVLGLVNNRTGQVTRGSVRYGDRDLLRLPESQLRQIRGRDIAMVFQSALAALNPSITVGAQIAEMFVIHRGTGRAEARKRAAELMDRVRIPSARSRMNDFPHQFSGGMRQRVMIAMAIALNPRVLIADEPTTALDVTVQAQIMALLAELRRETGMGLILITHDLGVVAEVADRVVVMYAGRVLESGTVADLFDRPAHPYTVGLLGSIPTVHDQGERLRVIDGQPPDLRAIPSGCEFGPRCPRVVDRCRAERPVLASVSGAHASACHFREEVMVHG